MYFIVIVLVPFFPKSVVGDNISLLKKVGKGLKGVIDTVLESVWEVCMVLK